MSTSGRELEDLVADLERQFVPHGLEVNVRQREIVDGVQIAEFDVVISGPVGSTSVSWLLSCRDRPSSGPAPSEWIEQLVGRRSRFHWDKVFAVSTTGFARPAEEYAAQAGVMLRTVTRIVDVARDFHCRDLSIEIRTMEQTGAMELEGSTCIPVVGTQQPPPELKFPNQTEYELWSHFMGRGLEEQGARIPAPGCAVDCQIELRGAVDVRFGADEYRVSRIRVPVQMRCFAAVGPCLMGHRYEESGCLIASEGLFVSLTSDNRRLLNRVIERNNGDGTFTPSIVPLEMPDSMVVSGTDIVVVERPVADSDSSPQ